jgi:hypothetical protein
MKFNFEVWQRGKGKLSVQRVTGTLISLDVSRGPYIVILDDKGGSWNFAVDSVVRIAIDPVVP